MYVDSRRIEEYAIAMMAQRINEDIDREILKSLGKREENIMSASGPVVCHSCWEAQENHYDPCDCVMAVYEQGKRAGKVEAAGLSNTVIKDAIHFISIDEHREAALLLGAELRYLEALIEDRE